MMFISALILAGGKSSRMEYQNKAYLKWKGKFLIEHIIEEASKVSDEILISQAKKDKIYFPQHKIVYDEGESHGPISGIESALLSCCYDKLLVIACDMPKIKAEIFEILLELLEEKDCDAVVPVILGRRQPLVAVYHRRILSVVKSQIEQEYYSMNRLLDKLNVFYIGEEEMEKRGISKPEILFSNINTKMEYEGLL
ncbi:MAG: molybdenum cofactor guanylyltransferase [Lachnospiraceae bacterium]